MNRIAAICVIALAATAGIYAQGPKTGKPAEAAPAAVADKAAAVLANATVAAHGGDKLKQLKSLVLRGTVDITTSAMNQSIPSTFITVISGDKYNYEINNPFQPLKQVFDGSQTFTTLKGFSLPPITSLGFPLLIKVGTAGYVVTPLGTAKGKRNGFRVTTPEGYYTDFLTDEKTNVLKGYESSYDYDGRTITTSVVVDKCTTVDGVLIPEKYSQRFDLGGLTAYADFKSKIILVNSTIEADVFAMPKN
jgi:hypothetical protein